MPPNPELYVVTTLMVHYAKGVAHAALGDFEAADRERSRFDAGCAVLPEGRIFANETAPNVMAVAREMLYGEMAYHQGNHEAGFAHLREAVRRNDNLRYSEPWPWMHPPRHALGALLLEQGRLEEAEQVYRADLGLDDTVRRCLQNRENVWSLHGYHECLQRMGRDRGAASLAPSLAAARRPERRRDRFILLIAGSRCVEQTTWRRVPQIPALICWSFFSVGCVGHPGLDPGSSSRGTRHRSS